MISREEAIETLYEIIGSGIIAEEIEYRLQDIASCIEAELIGRHEWDADSHELSVLYTAKREDLVTDEDLAEYDRIHRKLTFVPSIDERIFIETNIREKIEDATGIEAEVENINDWFRRN